MIKNKKNIYFFICGIVNCLLFSLFYFVEPARLLINDTGRLTAGSNLIFALVIFILLLEIVIYLLAFKSIKTSSMPFRQIAIFAVLFHLIGFFIWPVTSHDVFNYTNFARVATHSRANPYLESYDQFPDDPLYSTTRTEWSGTRSPYGPIFTTASQAVSRLAGDSFLLYAYGFKLLATLLSLAIFFIIYLIFKNPLAAFLYGWNPLVIFEFAVNGHNDALTIFFLALAAWFIQKRTTLASGLLSTAMLTLAVLVKFIPLIYLPFLFIYWLWRLEKKAKLIYLLAAPALFAGLYFIAYAPYWFGPQTFFGTLVVGKAYITVGNHCLVRSSPFIGAVSCLPYLFDAARNVNLRQVFDTIVNIGRAFFLIGYALAAVWFFKKSETISSSHLFQAWAIAAALFFSFTLPLLHPWYLTNLIALLIIFIAAADEYRHANYIFFVNFWAAFHYILVIMIF